MANVFSFPFALHSSLQRDNLVFYLVGGSWIWYLWKSQEHLVVVVVLTGFYFILYQVSHCICLTIFYFFRYLIIYNNQSTVKEISFFGTDIPLLINNKVPIDSEASLSYFLFSYLYPSLFSSVSLFLLLMKMTELAIKYFTLLKIIFSSNTQIN